MPKESTGEKKSKRVMIYGKRGEMIRSEDDGCVCIYIYMCIREQTKEMNARK